MYSQGTDFITEIEGGIFLNEKSNKNSTLYTQVLFRESDKMFKPPNWRDALWFALWSLRTVVTVLTRSRGRTDKLKIIRLPSVCLSGRIPFWCLSYCSPSVILWSRLFDPDVHTFGPRMPEGVHQSIVDRKETGILRKERFTIQKHSTSRSSHLFCCLS